jgi:hypothetical protein
MIEQHLKPAKHFEFWADDDEFYRVAAKTPRSNCVMDSSKLLSTGVRMRPVLEAVEASLRNWQAEGAEGETGREERVVKFRSSEFGD